ncbi:hypothetical protein [Streptomyces bambusae]|uniref:Uncharacterized protein n=1 Tax=Streptomyces bambusae TaxID=1550616 RepID=A0ABS6Z1G8_9ACTN|nr:hypothetical protein [Streptomyces bambusae]MBW5481577.1 hypothetical protein [Streptomyces bambusae]
MANYLGGEMGHVSGDARIASDETPRVRVIVALDPDHFDEAAAAARRAGLVIESEQRAIGTAVGTVPEDALAALSGAYGVEDVEREREYRLPDPDSPVQ